MLIDGEKWACEACVRGHRVSNCNHHDRKLQHIAKKGRPVSQCTHCRTLRKSRSAHVKCDCGEKAHNRGSCTKAKEGDSKDTCCCSHGGRCTCSVKKEQLEAVPESESDTAPRSTSSKPRRPRASTLQSESSGSVVPKANLSHHEVLKHQHAQRKQSQQFVAPRHPITGAGSLGLANRSVDNLTQLKDIHATLSDSHIKDSIVSAKQEHRQIKSEHASPVLQPVVLEPLHTNLPPLDFSMGEFDFNAPISNDFFYPEVDNTLFPTGLGPSATSVDWSHYDGLDFNNFNSNNNPSFAISNYSLAPSYNGYDFNPIEPQPALTSTSASGDMSEVEDGLFMGGPSRPQYQKYGSDYNADNDYYRPMINQNYSLNQNQSVPPPAPSNTSSGFDLDELLQVEREFAFNTGFPPPGQDKFPPASQEKAPQSYEAFSIPVDDTERPYSPYYTTYTTPPNSAVSNPGQDNWPPL